MVNLLLTLQFSLFLRSGCSSSCSISHIEEQAKLHQASHRQALPAVEIGEIPSQKPNQFGSQKIQPDIQEIQQLQQVERHLHRRGLGLMFWSS